MKKIKNPIFIRYEFSDEKGRLEGGDILQFSTVEQIQDFASEILEVSLGDKVTVNLTIGREVSFFGFLKSVGMSRKDAELEMVEDALDIPASAPAPKAGQKTGKKKPAKKLAKKKTPTKKK